MQQVLPLLRNVIPLLLIRHPKDIEGLLVPAVGASGDIPVHLKDALLGLDLVNLKARVTSPFLNIFCC